MSWVPIYFFSFQLDICILVRMNCKCKNNPDCYICGNVVLPNRQAKITDFVKKAYCNYQCIMINHSLPTFVVKCVENLRDWRKGKRKSMPFAIPMVWWEGKNHIMHCYLCMINLKGINRKNKHHVQYPDVPSAIRSIPHGSDLPVEQPDVNMEYRSDSEYSAMTCNIFTPLYF